LEVTSSAAARTGVGTGRSYSFGARLENVDGVAAVKIRRRLRNSDAHKFTGQRVPYEDDATIVGSPDASAGRGTFDANRHWCVLWRH
jgi:hypothetical protein